MKLLPTVLALPLIAWGQLSSGAGNINATLGSRQLDEDFWAPVDHQPTIGVVADFSLAQLPLYASVGLQVSAEKKSDAYFEFTSAVADLSAGLKLMPRTGKFRPYFGAGLASVGASFKAESNSYYYNDVDDSDQSFGYYVNGGALFRIGRHVNIGIDLRLIKGTNITMFGINGDANSFVGSVLVGYGWD